MYGQLALVRAKTLARIPAATVTNGNQAGDANDGLIGPTSLRHREQLDRDMRRGATSNTFISLRPALGQIANALRGRVRHAPRQCCVLVRVCLRAVLTLRVEWPAS